jgi:hypothetical protein
MDDKDRKEEARIKDRRFSDKKDDKVKEGSRTVKEKGEKRRENKGEKAEKKTVPITFISFIMSLATSALIYLGETLDPSGQEEKTDLAAAQQIIDIIDILKKKTEGNRTEEESKLIEELLYKLRMIYLKKSNIIKL